MFHLIAITESWLQESQLITIERNLGGLWCHSADMNIKCINYELVDLLGLTDHLLDNCTLDVTAHKIPPKNITCRDYTHFDIESCSRDAALIDWDRICHMDGIDNGVKFLTRAVCTLFNWHAPLRTISFSAATALHDSKYYEVNKIQKAGFQGFFQNKDESSL
ncbi:hypothetical protein WA026_007093 [Henosepilachna vigintioctopunctata]|uniref:Uncharacterized protein n=1 Tax=Henosepilachna vigintioctopunctata TaxID=420089 RepID=A0AAW1VBT0_9CUCU